MTEDNVNTLEHMHLRPAPVLYMTCCGLDDNRLG